ncbi:MAG TPA: glycosyltransferase family 39 protein [Gemmatimonadaceae bacterium]|nr:glycosyltransferase family 39 protein [Gemmatimonadaceae bacterium]
MTEQGGSVVAGGDAGVRRGALATLGARGMRAIPWLVPLVVFVVALRAVDYYPVGVAYDDAVYVELAKSLATGHGYRYLHLPGTPFATHYPPGYPFFLSLLWRAWPDFPGNVLLFKVANAVLVALIAVGLARWARERFELPPGQAAMAALVASLGIPTLILSALVMSETLFVAMLLAALILGERVVGGERRAGWLVGAGVVGGMTTLVRMQGVAVLGAVVLLLMFRRRFRDAAWYAGGAGLLVVPWQWWVAAHAGAIAGPLQSTFGPYFPWWLQAMRDGGVGFFLSTVAATTHLIALQFAIALQPIFVWGAGIVGFLVALVVAGVGAWRARQVAPVTLGFLAIYFGLIIIWPYPPGRFVWGIWPLAVMLVLLGLRALVRREVPGWLARRGRAGLLVAALIPVLGYARYTVRGYSGAWWTAIPRGTGPQLRAQVLTARADTVPGTVFATTYDVPIYLYSGHQAVLSSPLSAGNFLHPTAVDQGVQELREVLKAYPVTRVIAMWGPQVEVARLLAAAHPPELALTDSFPDGLIYSTIRE